MSAMIESLDRPRFDEPTTLLDVIESTLRIQTRSEFLAWTEGPLQDIFPHESLICGVGQIGQHSIHMQHHLFKRFPLPYIKAIRQADDGIHSPIMARWCKEQKPQLFEPGKLDSAVDSRWLGIFHQYDLRNIAAHGMHDLNSNVASYFSFSRIPEALTARHSHLLELLVPHMHVALGRALAQAEPMQPPKPAAHAAITPHESAVLHWIREGKTNGEIAQILSRSEHTIKNHVRAILLKLRVNNRTQAVSKAMTLGIVG